MREWILVYILLLVRFPWLAGFVGRIYGTVAIAAERGRSL